MWYAFDGPFKLKAVTDLSEPSLKYFSWCPLWISGVGIGMFFSGRSL